VAFWRLKDRDLREREWRAFAGAFELEPAPALAETLREDLDLGPGAIATVYERARPDQPDTVVFEQANDRDGPAGTLTGLRIGVVVRSSVEHSSVSLRASARRHKILEGLVAGRSGAQRLDGAFDPEFDAAVSVYAREVDQATALLTRPVRTVLARLLGEADEVVVGLAEGLRAALDQDRLPDVLAGLATLEQLVLPASHESAGIWDQGAWRFLEVILWGLAGVLVHKIITIAWWLRSSRFYREGIVMHVAHILTTPLLVLVAVLLLSLATLSITLAGGNQLTIDLSDPRILAAVSFLLGSSPWPLWDFIEGTAKRITGKVE